MRPEAAFVAPPVLTDRHCTLLLVDDDDDVRELLGLCLQGVGYEVLTAHSGQGALDLLGRSSLQIDLLITDVDMPGISGIELAAATSEGPVRPPVLLISGRPGAAMDVGCGWEFLAKPFAISVFLEKIRCMLERSPCQEPVFA